MAVIILILKIIGIALLVLLCLILLILGAALFVPVRYRITGRQTAGFDTAEVQIRASWLFHLVSYRFSYPGGGTGSGLRICGILRRKCAPGEDEDFWEEPETAAERPAKAGESAAKRPAKAGESTAETAAGRPAGSGKSGGNIPAVYPAESREEGGTSEPQEERQEKAAGEAEKSRPAGSGKSGGNIPAVYPAESREEGGTSEPQSGRPPDASGREPSGHPENEASGSSAELPDDGVKPPWADRAAQLFRTLQQLPGRIRAAIRGAADAVRRTLTALRQLTERAAGIKAAVADETNRTAVFGILGELKFLLSHFRFRKVHTELTFSLGDPAATGQALGFISVMPFVYRYRCGIYPDFLSEELYLRGEFDIRGRARMIHVLRSLIRLYRQKEFRIFIRRIMNR